MKNIINFFKNSELQLKMINAFILMGIIIFFVALIGWQSSLKLSHEINEISSIRLPSIVSLQKIDQGIRDIYYKDLALLNNRLGSRERQVILNQIKDDDILIKTGFSHYEPLPRTTEENELWNQFKSRWNQWEKQQASYMNIYKQFQDIGILSPYKTQLNLWQSGQQDSTKMEKARQAAITLTKLNVQALSINKPTFYTTAKSLEKVIEENQKIAQIARNNADETIKNSQIWSFLGMVFGPLTALSLGIILSLAIARPISQSLKGLVNTVVNSSSEIAATVEEQERIIALQAESVHKTTTTMDQLGSASRQAAQDAEAAATVAQKVLKLAHDGANAVSKTVSGMVTLETKVSEISCQIITLNQQAQQINHISNLVSDIAHQTNMLALNATIEAVRAGEQGLGFNVVATEIRKLADETNQSARKITELINEIKKSVNSAVAVAEDGKRTVQNNLKIAEETTAIFSGVTAAIDQVALSSQQIYLTSKQQVTAIEQVISAMNSINNGAQQTVIGINQTKSETQQLKNAAYDLKILGIG